MILRSLAAACSLILAGVGPLAAEQPSTSAAPLVLDVLDATVNQDTLKPRLVVLAILNDQSAKAFADYTHGHRDQIADIMIDEVVAWSPRIVDAISTGHVPVMTFELSQMKEARMLATRLKAHQVRLSVRPKPLPPEINFPKNTQ